ncbi:hypothetical protein ACPUYX_13840 [Desulfosporosinus sp. SYSU MS00001]|uniref:hypothetical protein n=1 Tax=Desulfosporosinus sp. SYSU MS00001 TaxID=3416284 RepID=UPI003CFAEFCF
MEIIKQIAGIIALLSVLIAAGGLAIAVPTRELVTISSTMDLIDEGKTYAGIWLMTFAFAAIILKITTVDLILLHPIISLIILISVIIVMMIYLFMSEITIKYRKKFLSSGPSSDAKVLCKTKCGFYLVSIISFLNCILVLKKVPIDYSVMGIIVIFYIITLLCLGTHLCVKSIENVRLQKIAFYENQNLNEVTGYLLGENKQLVCFLGIYQRDHKRIFVKKDLITQIKDCGYHY